MFVIGTVQWGEQTKVHVSSSNEWKNAGAQ